MLSYTIVSILSYNKRTLRPYTVSVYYFSALLHFGNIFSFLQRILHALNVRATIKTKGESVALRCELYNICVELKV